MAAADSTDLGHRTSWAGRNNQVAGMAYQQLQDPEGFQAVGLREDQEDNMNMSNWDTDSTHQPLDILDSWEGTYNSHFPVAVAGLHWQQLQAVGQKTNHKCHPLEQNDQMNYASAHHQALFVLYFPLACLPSSKKGTA